MMILTSLAHSSVCCNFFNNTFHESSFGHFTLQLIQEEQLAHDPFSQWSLSCLNFRLIISNSKNSLLYQK